MKLKEPVREATEERKGKSAIQLISREAELDNMERNGATERLIGLHGPGLRRQPHRVHGDYVDRFGKTAQGVADHIDHIEKLGVS